MARSPYTPGSGHRTQCTPIEAARLQGATPCSLLRVTVLSTRVGHGSPMCSSRVIISCPYSRRARPRLKRVPVQRHGRPPVLAVEPGISRLTSRADRANSVGLDMISQIPPNTATTPIHTVGWELSSELLTWSFSGAPLRNRTVDLLLTMHTGFV